MGNQQVNKRPSRIMEPERTWIQNANGNKKTCDNRFSMDRWELKECKKSGDFIVPAGMFSGNQAEGAARRIKILFLIIYCFLGPYT
jgi:hypothetical protein